MSELFRLQVEVRLQGMLCVGGPGRPHPVADRVVALDEQGLPYLPASTVRGRLRAHLERLLRAYDRPVCEPPRPARMCPHAALKGVSDGYCVACKLFGSPWREAAVLCSDFRLADGVQAGVQPGADRLVPTVLRTEVGIARKLGTVSEGRLFFTEAVPQGTEQEPVRFVGEMEARADRSEIGWLVAAMALVTHLGGQKGRGPGRVSIRLAGVSWWKGGSEWVALDADGFGKEVVNLALPGLAVP